MLTTMKNQTGALVIFGILLLCLIADARKVRRDVESNEIDDSESKETFVPEDKPTLEYEGPKAVMLDQQWSITCSGIPENSKVVWKRNGLIPRDDLYSGLYTVVPGFVDYSDKENLNMINSTLIAWKAQPIDAGYYTCLDGPESHTLMFVEESYEGPKTVVLEDDFKITCIGVLPGSTISWKFNGETPQADLRSGLMAVETDYDDNGMIRSTLMILKALEHHTGNYSCVPTLKPHHVKIVKGSKLNY